MTGEMAWINQDGVDSNGETWEVHAAVASAIGGKLKPFDAYQGPYIVIGPDVVVGDSPYRVPVHLGSVRLWLALDERGMGQIYREDTGTLSKIFLPWDEEAAIEAAREILK